MPPRDLFGLLGATLADKFRVERVLGEGGFGVVYGGTHLLLGVPVAIKCLKPSNPSPSAREHAAQAFLREARILFSLGHPSIVRLYDVGVIPVGQVPYAVLELLSGPTLADEIATRRQAEHPFTKDELASIFVPILEAVGFAHERGVVHRDLKPSNLMLVTDAAGRTLPKVLDFGTARSDAAGVGAASEGLIELARSGATALGSSHAAKTGFTPLYAAPEQWDAAFGRTGPRTDVFSLGVTIAEACLLAYPFDVAQGLMAIFRSISDDRGRPSIRARRADLPVELDQVVARALRVQPEARFPDARELCAAFRTALKVTVTTVPLARPLAPTPLPPSPSFAETLPGADERGPSAPPPRVSSPHAASITPSSGGHARRLLGPSPQALPGASTTQPQAFSAPPASGGSALPWVIGGGGVLVAVLALGLGFFVVLRDGAATAPSTPARSTAPTAPTATAPPPATAAPTVTAPAASASGRAIAPSKADAPRTKRVVLASAIGMTPWWTQADVLAAAKPHEAEVQACVDDAAKDFPRLATSIDVIVHGTKDGTVEDTQCSLRDHSDGEAGLCNCVSASIGKWKLPPPRGKLGMLEAGNFIVEYKITPLKP